MGVIELETLIRAPIERCFDLSRSVDVHLVSAESTNERAVAGVVTGLLNLGDTVTWEAKHFGVNHRMTVTISEFERPKMFADIQVKGPFKSFRHTHSFESADTMTLMKDVFEFVCPFGVLGSLVDPIITRHLRKFLIERNQVIKKIAEGEAWRSILK